MRKIIAFFIAVTAGIAQLSAQSFPLDYSYCGYRMSEQPIPDVPVAVFVGYKPGDNAARIQRAIDYVSSLRPDRKTGVRGAVLLDRGTFELSLPLRISASGVVLRGVDKKATVFRKHGVDRGAIVYLEGRNDLRVTDTLRVAADVPLGSRHIPVSPSSKAASPSLKAGDEVMIWRPSTAEWIAMLGCGDFGGGQKFGYWGWHPGELDVVWSRRVNSSTVSGIVLDAPLSMALDRRWADAKLLRYVWPGRMECSGVENLTLEADCHPSRPMDEDHAWDGVYIANARNCWVRMVEFRHLAGSAVVVQRSGQQVTVEDCISREPVSEVGGMRRRTFLVLGEKCLFQRCYSEQGINDFSAGFCAAGPNAFVQCDTKESLGFSGASSSWATGLLFDVVNIDGNDLKFTNLGLEKYGTGWNTTNSLAYQCTASGIYADSLPDGSTNQVYGCWAQFNGTGRFASLNNHVRPRSVFAEQLRMRIGRIVDNICRTLNINIGESSSPTIEEAQAFTAMARHPRTTMEMWIDSARLVPQLTHKSGRDVDALPVMLVGKPVKQPVFAVKDGRLVIDGCLAVGGRHNVPWWNGRMRYSAMEKADYGVTRFVPGMEGRGATDRIDSVVATMGRSHTLVLHQNYGLWYDRRRDDHERVRRRGGDVWAPFYEQPFARSGQGKAWDGLSRYDLTQSNPWYYQRLNEFADKGSREGLLLFNEHYFQHNILEAGAHWVDCPWRSANNVNATGFPEPVPFAGDKRVFMAEYFYDVTHPVRRELHRQYIFRQLDALADHPNVIHSIGEEFTGPLPFVRFWLDTVCEWKSKTKKKVLIALAVTRDVQDSIMADSVRSKAVDIIDIQQWYYHNKGLYAPQGGLNMAPRQYARKIKAGNVGFDEVYRAVEECRKAYPDKAVVYYAPRYPELAWAVLMAGGSCPAVAVRDEAFLRDVARMAPSGNSKGVCTMENPQGGALFYLDGAGKSASVTLAKGLYRLYQIVPQTGELLPVGSKRVLAGRFGWSEKGVFWLKRLK